MSARTKGWHGDRPCKTETGRSEKGARGVALRGGRWRKGGGGPAVVLEETGVGGNVASDGEAAGFIAGGGVGGEFFPGGEVLAEYPPGARQEVGTVWDWLERDYGEGAVHFVKTGEAGVGAP